MWQTVVDHIMIQCFSSISIPGIHLLAHHLLNGVQWNWGDNDNKERLYFDLRQMFPISADEKLSEVKLLTESYHKYKREYVKHIYFNPAIENLCKFFLTS